MTKAGRDLGMRLGIDQILDAMKEATQTAYEGLQYTHRLLNVVACVVSEQFSCHLTHKCFLRASVSS